MGGDAGAGGRYDGGGSATAVTPKVGDADRKPMDGAAVVRVLRVGYTD